LHWRIQQKKIFLKTKAGGITIPDRLFYRALMISMATQKQMQKLTVDPYFSPCTKINSKWIKVLTIRSETETTTEKLWKI
jgi:hypothetical protein